MNLNRYLSGDWQSMAAVAGALMAFVTLGHHRIQAATPVAKPVAAMAHAVARNFERPPRPIYRVAPAARQHLRSMVATPPAVKPWDEFRDPPVTAAALDYGSFRRMQMQQIDWLRQRARMSGEAGTGGIPLEDIDAMARNGQMPH